MISYDNKLGKPFTNGTPGQSGEGGRCYCPFCKAEIAAEYTGIIEYKGHTNTTYYGKHNIGDDCKDRQIAQLQERLEAVKGGDAK